MSEERNLVTIQKIESLEEIPGADFILKAKLYDLEWQFVVKKNDFKIDDLCVYFEIDSLLPEKPWSEFMRERKFRVKTIKLRKVVSQGLCLPLNMFSELDNMKLKIGLDVTELLGVKKYLTPTERKEMLMYKNRKKTFLEKYFGFKKNKRKGRWPKFVKKTEETRVQNFNYQKLYNQYKDEDKKFYVTEKIDYQSVTFFTKNEKRFFFFRRKYFGVCSRNIWLKKEDNSLYWKIARKYNIEKILKSQKNEIIIQGEQGGPGIQDNKYGLSDFKLWVFNVIEILNGIEYHYDYNEMKEFCDEHGLETVPFIEYYKLPETVSELIEYSKGKSLLNNKIDREGVVLRLVKNGGKAISFKVVNPDFLLKYGD